MFPMMRSAAPHSPHHHLRFYVVVATLIIGSFVFFLLMNGEKFSFTGTTIGDLTGSNVEDQPEGKVTVEKAALNKVFKDEVEKNNNEVNLALTFSNSPDVSKFAELNSLVLTFDDLTTNIKINDDQLEVNNLQQVQLVIKDFKGDFDLTGKSLSLEGSSTRIEVNGVALQSGKEMKIAFENLDFKSLAVEGITLTDVSLPEGDGQLSVGERLEYSLQGDALEVYYIDGDMSMTEETPFSLTGLARGIFVNGDSLTLHIQ